MNELLKERETVKSSQSWFWNEKESLEDRNEVGEKEKNKASTTFRRVRSADVTTSRKKNRFPIFVVPSKHRDPEIRL